MKLKDCVGKVAARLYEVLDNTCSLEGKTDYTCLMDLGNGSTFRHKSCVYRVVRKTGLDVVVNKIIDEAGMYVDEANEVMNGCVRLKHTVDRGYEVVAEVHVAKIIRLQNLSKGSGYIIKDIMYRVVGYDEVAGKVNSLIVARRSPNVSGQMAWWFRNTLQASHDGSLQVVLNNGFWEVFDEA